MRKHKTRKTQKGGGWFGTKKKPLSTAPTVNTYNYSQNTEDRASALAWLEKEEKIMNTAQSVDEAVKGLVALESERGSVPETEDIPGDDILDQEISDLQDALTILKSGDNPTSMLETLKTRHPKIYSSLSSIISYMGVNLQKGGGERNRGGHYSTTNHAMIIGQGALLQQSAASGSFDSGSSGSSGEAMAAIVVITIFLSFIILGICVAIKTSRVLYRISKYIFKIMLINYKKRVHLQKNKNLSNFPYAEPKMQPIISRWWGGKKSFGLVKFLPNVGGVIKNSNAQGWNLETTKVPTVAYNPMYKAVTWTKVTEGPDTWYESSDGKSTWDLPAGAILR